MSNRRNEMTIYNRGGIEEEMKDNINDLLKRYTNAQSVSDGIAILRFARQGKFEAELSGHSYIEVLTRWQDENDNPFDGNKILSAAKQGSLKQK